MPCNGQEGQYVKLVNTHNYLEIAEVQVYGESTAVFNLKLSVCGEWRLEVDDKFKKHSVCTAI